MAEEWRTIVAMKPENIGVTPDEAVKQLLDHYEAKKKDCRLSLPNTLALPIDPSARLAHLIEAVKGLGCPVAKDVANIIAKVLWRYVRELPIQCRQGEVGAKARDFLKVCNRGQYKPALAWMAEQNILRVTDPNYINSRKTRRYFVNIPLILHLLGFRSEELDWSQGQGWSVGDLDELLWAS
jgi:hypothetical protein